MADMIRSMYEVCFVTCSWYETLLEIVLLACFVTTIPKTILPPLVWNVTDYIYYHPYAVLGGALRSWFI